MRTVPLIAAALALVVACDGATAPRAMQSSVDDSRLPPQLRAAYAEDAAHLGLRDLLTHGFTDVRIPEEATRPYYDALVLVYNATALPARDSVVDVFHIHTFGMPPTRSLMMELDTTEAWVRHLASNQIPTGNADVDTLLSRYSLSLGRVYAPLSRDVLVTLDAPQALNINGLAPLFRRIPGVVYSDPDGLVGDGNDIRGSRELNTTLLTYSVAYGDCFAGCISRRSYIFSVHGDGTVEYLGASGSPPPSAP